MILRRSKLAVIERCCWSEQIKPDGVHRSLVGDIVKRFEAKGYKLVGIKVRLLQLMC